MDAAELYCKDGFDVIFFMTIATARRAFLLGKADKGTVLVNEYGYLAYKLMGKLDGIVRGIRIDNYTVMPNHVHMLVCARSYDGIAEEDGSTLFFSVSANFKYLSASLFTEIESPGPSVPRAHRWWEHSYSAKRVGSLEEYLMAHEYINNNPSLWETDVYNPASASYIGSENKNRKNK